MKQLNLQQQAVVDSTSNKILCLAGAGAGKTATMLERISRLVKDGTHPGSILVLTFTNAAALEMKDRYKKMHPKEMIPEFRTFHSFCYSVMSKDREIRKALGYSSTPRIVDSSELQKIEKETKMQLDITIPDKKLKGGVDLTKQEQYQVQLYLKALKKNLRARDAITFDILSKEVSDLFVQDHGSTLKYKEKYTCIFVDEFQDTDNTQIAFLNSFDNSDFCFVGDTLQNIYKFRGCSNDTIKMLSCDPSWEQIKLYKNYRSTNQICEFANEMSTYADDAYRIEMEGQRDGESVKVYRDAYCYGQEVVDLRHTNILIRELKDHPDTETAVLCRTNKEVDYICDSLDKHGIMYVRGQVDRDSIHILKSVSDDEYMYDWLSTFLSAEKYMECIRLAAQEENPNVRWFANMYGKYPKIKQRGTKISNIRKILKSDDPVITKCINILSVLEIHNVELECPPDDPKMILPYMIERVNESKKSQLYVGTIHSSKGLEYDSVYVMGVDDSYFQLFRSEENMNLYYVAITRAKNHLTVFTA